MNKKIFNDFKKYSATFEKEVEMLNKQLGTSLEQEVKTHQKALEKSGKEFEKDESLKGGEE